MSGGSGDDTSSGDGDAIGSEECNVPELFVESCSGAICHGSSPGDEAHGVNLMGENLAERLVDVEATAYRSSVSDPENCPTEPELFIDSQELEQSLMWTKLVGTHACGDGMPIPFSVLALGDEDLNCVYEWMEELVSEKYPR